MDHIHGVCILYDILRSVYSKYCSYFVSDAIKDCSEAIQLSPEYSLAFLRNG